MYQQDGKTKKERAGHGWVYILYCCAKTAARSKSAAPVSPAIFTRRLTQPLAANSFVLAREARDGRQVHKVQEGVEEGPEGT